MACPSPLSSSLWPAGLVAAAVLCAWQPAAGPAGSYRNPVIHADYSDPDAVRVGRDYFMIASSFSHVPGLPILHSRDLVHWRLVNHALPRLVPEAAFAAPQHGGGVWAPAIRHHGGRFWIYYPDPDHGLYMITATDPRGRWSAPVLVKAGKGLIDPCPLWDEDGRVYLIHAWARSRAGFNNVLTLNRLSDDGRRAVDEGRVIIDGGRFAGYTTLEGPKFYKRDRWYYVFAPAGGVKQGWQSVFRSRAIDGPYEARIVLAQGRTGINGPHQGALVDTPSGASWFLHFQDHDAYGRIVHLQPVEWREGWPVMGRDDDGDGTGEPLREGTPPDAGAARSTDPPDLGSDEFDAARFNLHWQWQANPRPGWAELAKGSLRLAAVPEPAPGNLWNAPNLLLQKFAAPAFEATAALSLSDLRDEERAGLIVFGTDYATLGVRRTAGALRVEHTSAREAHLPATREQSMAAVPVDGAEMPGDENLPRVFLKVTVADGAVCRFSYSVDGRTFTSIGDPFTARAGRWVGAKVGLFAAATPAASRTGRAIVDWFRIAPSGSEP